MKRKFTVLVAIVICFTLLFGGCGEKKEEPTALDTKIIATINGTKVSQAEYNLMYKIMYDNMSQYATYYGEDWINLPFDETRTMGDFMKSNVAAQMEQFVAAKAIAEEKYGIKMDDSLKKAAAKQKEKYIESIGGEEAYKAFLKETRTTNIAMTKNFEFMEVYTRLVDKITAKGEEAYLSEDEAFELFKDSNMRVQHILISTQAGTDDKTGEATEARSDEDALKIANKVIAKLDAGEDFDSLIEEYDEDPGMEKGKFYVFGSGKMVAEFEDASRNLEIGKYTKEPVKTDYGYHIIKRYEVNKDLDEFKEFKETNKDMKLNNILSEKIASFKIDWKSDEVSSYISGWINEMRIAQGLEPFEEEKEAEAETEKKADKKTDKK